MTLPPRTPAGPAARAATTQAPRAGAPARRAPAKGSAKAAKAKGPRPLRLLPVTIFGVVLLLGARVGDVWVTVTTGAAFPGASAVAETAPVQGLREPAAEQKADAGSVAKPVQVAEAKPAEPTPAAAPAAPSPTPAAAQPQPGPQPSGAPGQAFTPTELELLQRLQERREQLDQRGRELDQREAMLAAAEQRFDQKIAELQALRKEIQGLLVQVNQEQAGQLDSLVKIYETMKPKEAANIFNTLEKAVLLNVISRMKESKAAPVLAAMDPQRAQEVTILLAERKKLPAVPE